MSNGNSSFSKKFSFGAMITLLLVVMAPQLGLSVITPSFARMASDLNVNVAQLQWTTTIYMAGYALSMFVGGFLAEKYDAVKLQAFGLIVFSIGSILCAFSQSIFPLSAGRFLQALGGTSATVLCRLIIRRRIDPAFRIAPLANLTMVISLTPALAPLLGGVASLFFPWRAIFVVLAVLGITLSLLCLGFLGSAKADEPSLPSLASTLSSIGASLSNLSYLWYSAALALVWMSYFGFLALSPGFFETNYGITGISYGVLMLWPAVGYWFGSYLIKYTANPTKFAHTSIMVSGLVALAVLLVGLVAPLLLAWVVIAILCTQFIGVGATIPYSQNGQLALPLPLPGVSTGLFFFIQMMSGAVYAAVANSFEATSFRSVLAFVAAPQLVLCLAFVAISLIGGGGKFRVPTRK